MLMSDINIETFRFVNGYNDYMISNFGRVFNVKTLRMLNPSSTSEGYRRINLSKHGEAKEYKIHRLVAGAFLKNPKNKHCIDHIDNDRSNNNISNLRYVTGSENGQNSQLYKNNTSSCKGVYFKKQNQKWAAEITFDKKNQYRLFHKY